MNRTKIEWCRNPDGTPGYTWNPITGCLNGCEYCYARRLANSRVKSKYLANKNVAPWGQFAEDLRGDTPPDKFGYGNAFYPRLWENKLTADKNNPLSRKEPIGVFVCNMGDLFGISVPEEWTKQVLEHIEKCPQHRFYLLTKQPQNLAKFSPFPDNCWVGVTITSSTGMTTAAYYLSAIRAKVKFFSFEPLLGHIPDYQVSKTWCDWVIIGAQSKPTVYPKIEWVQEIVEAADKAGVKVFLKNNLKPFLDTVPTRIVYQYGSGKLRQEVPSD